MLAEALDLQVDEDPRRQGNSHEQGMRPQLGVDARHGEEPQEQPGEAEGPGLGGAEDRQQSR